MKMTSATRVAAMALGLSLVGASAFAAPPEGRDRGNNPTANSQNNDDRDGANDRRKGDRGDGKADANRQNRSQPGELDWRREGARNNGDRRANDDNRGDRRDARDNGERRRYDVQKYRRNFNAPRRFRAENYRWRDGQSYRRYSYGQRLPRNFFGRSFWLTNFIGYGLFAPPSGYVWVRYGPDALLIDEYTGEIVQVRYNMFYS